jgi:hypothetical protein
LSTLLSFAPIQAKVWAQSPAKEKAPAKPIEKKHEHSEEREEDSHKHSEKEDKGKHDDHGGEESHGHGHGNEESRFGKGKAIEETKSDGNAFRLSPEAERVLAVRLGSVTRIGESAFQVPASALVEFQDRYGIFVKRDGWFWMLPIKLSGNDGTRVRLESGRLKDNDQVVVSGTPLLRVAHLEATGQGGQGHAH